MLCQFYGLPESKKNCISRLSILMFCKAQVRKCKAEPVFCSYVLVNSAFLLQPKCISSPLSSEEKNVTDWIRVLFVWIFVLCL